MIKLRKFYKRTIRKILEIGLDDENFTFQYNVEKTCTPVFRTFEFWRKGSYWLNTKIYLALSPMPSLAPYENVSELIFVYIKC